METIDEGIDTGVTTSLALDSTGFPHVAYLHPREDAIRYARWNGTEWNVEAVDQGHHFLGEVNLVLDAEDRPHLSYFRGEIGFVMYTTWNGSEWTIRRVARGMQEGVNNLALNATGRPLVAYTYLNGQPRLSTWNGSGWTVETVDPRLITARHVTLALDSTQRPHVAYYAIGTLHYARRGEEGWSVEVVDAGGDKGRFASLAVDSRDRPHVAYQDVGGGVLRYAVDVGDRWHLEAVDYEGDTGWDVALSVWGDTPHIAYYERTEADLRYAVRTVQGWATQTVDADGVVGWFASLALNSAGRPHISYYNWSGGTVKYARAAFGAVVRTLAPDEVTPTAAKVRGEVLSLGDLATVNVTFEWRPAASATWKATPPLSVSAVGATEALLTNLTPETSYEYRIRATAAGTTVYGEVNTFETAPAPEEREGVLDRVDWYLVAAGVAVAIPPALALLWLRRRRIQRDRV